MSSARLDEALSGEDKAGVVALAPLAGEGSIDDPGGSRQPRAASPDRRGRPLGAPVATAIWLLVSIGALLVWALVYLCVLGGVQEHRAQHVMLARFREERAAGTLAAGGDIPHGTPVAVLQIPAIAVRNLVVVEGTTSGDLESGPGHRRDTPLPGEEGTSYLLGRGRFFGGPFARVALLPKGATVAVVTGVGTFSFKVEAVRRPGDPLSPFVPGASRLTLVTSQPTRHGLEVVYVDATLTGTPAPSLAAGPGSILSAEQQLQGDHSVWLPLVFWFEGLLVVSFALAWSSRHWRPLQAAVVAVPLLLAFGWGIAATLSRLLPNLL